MTPNPPPALRIAALEQQVERLINLVNDLRRRIQKLENQ